MKTVVDLSPLVEAPLQNSGLTDDTCGKNYYGNLSFNVVGGDDYGQFRDGWIARSTRPSTYAKL